MHGAFQRIGQWLLKKLGGSFLILVLGLGLTGTWMYLKDSIDLEDRRTQLMQLISGERSHLQAARAEVLRRRQEMELALSNEQAKAKTAARALAGLDELQSGWSWVFGDREQQREYARRAEAMQRAQADALRKVSDLERLLQLEAYTLDGLDLALGKLDKRQGELEKTESKLMLYLRESWLKVRWHVISAVALWLLGPLVLSLLLYYFFAPWVMGRRPIRIKALSSALPEVAGSRVALDIQLEPGDVLRIKESHLQASDEGLQKRLRFLFDWRIPVTSIACRLTEMTELIHGEGEGVRRVTVANAKDPLSEISLVRIPEGASLVLRPRFIAGIVLPKGASLDLRRHWVFSRWQAWMSMQFRYFEFRGPLQLLIAGGRGIRVENLHSSEQDQGGARRVNSGTLVGFTPNLAYKPVRAETFWAYYRGQNPLFDDLFSGEGFFLCQASSAETPEGERFWAGLWHTLLKLVGF